MLDDLELATSTARAAGRLLMRYFGQKLEVGTKSSAIDLVTEADRAAEKVIVERLAKERPADGILAEESGEVSTGGRRWIVDPLDGTTNFSHGFPVFCVSIALYEGERALLGVIHDPTRDETFGAVAGQGAWLDSQARDRVRLTVTDIAELRASLLATGFAYRIASSPKMNLPEFNRLLPLAQGVRRPGSAALDLAYLAAGRLDGYWEYFLAPWDWAAGALIVREAGGHIATLDGSPWSLGSDSIVAAGATLLPSLLAELRAASARS